MSSATALFLGCAVQRLTGSTSMLVNWDALAVVTHLLAWSILACTCTGAWMWAHIWRRWHQWATHIHKPCLVFVCFLWCSWFVHLSIAFLAKTVSEWMANMLQKRLRTLSIGQTCFRAWLASYVVIRVYVLYSQPVERVRRIQDSISKSGGVPCCMHDQVTRGSHDQHLQVIQWYWLWKCEKVQNVLWTKQLQVLSAGPNIHLKCLLKYIWSSVQ